jgi:hypothetical protein
MERRSFWTGAGPDEVELLASLFNGLQVLDWTSTLFPTADFNQSSSQQQVYMANIHPPLLRQVADDGRNSFGNDLTDTTNDLSALGGPKLVEDTKDLTLGVPPSETKTIQPRKRARAAKIE